MKNNQVNTASQIKTATKKSLFLFGGGGEIALHFVSLFRSCTKMSKLIFAYFATPNSALVLFHKTREFKSPSTRKIETKRSLFFLAEEGRFELPLQVSPD